MATEVGGGSQRGTATSSGPVANLSRAFPGNVTSGNLLIIAGAGWTGGTPMVSGTVSTSGAGVAGSTWTVLVTSAVGTTNTRPFLAYALATANGPATVTFIPNTSVYMSFSVDEFSSVLAFDAAGASSAGTSTSPTDAVATTVSGDLVIGVVGPDGTPPAMTVNSPWTQIGQVANNGSSQSHVACFRTVGGAGSYSPSVTLASAVSWHALSAAWTSTGGGGGSTFPALLVAV